MVTFRDEKRNVTNLRKQILKVKGKLWIKAEYISMSNKKVYKTFSDAESEVLIKEIDMKRALYNAITKGMIIINHKYGVGSDLKLLKILDWGIQYGSMKSQKFNPVTVKRFKRGGKYYTGVWVKGSRGIKSVQKTKYAKKDELNKILKNEELLYVPEENVWSNEY